MTAIFPFGARPASCTGARAKNPNRLPKGVQPSVELVRSSHSVVRPNCSSRKIIKYPQQLTDRRGAQSFCCWPIRNASLHWRRPNEWTAAMEQFAGLLFGDALRSQRAGTSLRRLTQYYRTHSARQLLTSRLRPAISDPRDLGLCSLLARPVVAGARVRFWSWAIGR